MKLFSICVLMIFLSAGHVFAQDPRPNDSTLRKKLESVNTKAQAISTDLEAENLRHFQFFYHTANTIGTVETVQQSVRQATDACQSANPDLKEKISGRYTQWDEAIEPVLQEARAHLDNMIIAQDYAKPAEMQGLLKSLQEARALSNTMIVREPVTSPEACLYLHNKMDETQQTLTNLLRQTLISLPQAAVQ